MSNILISNTIPPVIVSADVSGFKYEMPDEQLRWQPPECFICHERKYCYDVPPYGSDYDGDIICGDCFHKHCDPGIKAALAEKEGKNE